MKKILFLIGALFLLSAFVYAEDVCCEEYGYGAMMVKTESTFTVMERDRCSISEGFVGGDKRIVGMERCTVEDERVCCYIFDETMPEPEYRIMNKAECGLDIPAGTATAGSSMYTVDMDMCTQKDSKVCCKITPIVPDATPGYAVRDKGECTNCRIGPDGSKGCSVGASLEVVEMDMCTGATRECGECPMFAPPAPDFCKDGEIRAPEPDGCGCSGPPICVMEASDAILGKVAILVQDTPARQVAFRDGQMTISEAPVAATEATLVIDNNEIVMSTKEGWTVMEQDGYEVRTKTAIAVDEDGMVAETLDGNEKIGILPAQASESARIAIGEAYGIELVKDKDGMAYKAEVEKRIRVLGFIPARATFIASVDALTGETTVHKPFIARISTVAG